MKNVYNIPLCDSSKKSELHLNIHYPYIICTSIGCLSEGLVWEVFVYLIIVHNTQLNIPVKDLGASLVFMIIAYH